MENFSKNPNFYYQWAVIGAGPAGIAAVGKLLDAGISGEQIAWIDPAFDIGDFGSKWQNVPSNTKVALFNQFLHACQAFNYQHSPKDLAIKHADPQKTCQLKLMKEALSWVNNTLQQQVNCYQARALSLSQQQAWQITLDNGQVSTNKVILAIGSEAKTLNFSDIEILSLATVLNPQQISQHCQQDDVVAVFGSSHSAILAIKNLLKFGVKKVINFHQSPLRYAKQMDGWILFDNTGLKGTTAEWAKQHLDNKLPPNLERHLSNATSTQQYLAQCNKVVYAIGFAPRSIKINALSKLHHNPYTGVIAPRLFGLGIAFPELSTDPAGNSEYRVGLWKFMDYLQRVLGEWIKD